MTDPPPIELVVTDMAGTTVADDGLVAAAFADTLDRMGVAADDPRRPEMERHVHATMGTSKVVVFRYLFGDEEAARRATHWFEEAVAARLDTVAEVPGSADAFDRLRADGRRVCLTTGFAPVTRDAIIDALGWWSRIDLALSPDEHTRGRPHPDLVLRAVLELEVSDVRAVAVVGDTVNDLLTGTRAGAGLVAGVATGAHDLATLAAAPHTHLLDRFADLVEALEADGR